MAEPLGARAVVLRLTARRAGRSAGVWAYAFSLFVGSSALGYAATYKTAAQRRQLVTTFGNNAGVDALIGRAHDISTVAGFTEWRSLGILSLVGAIWGVLLGTRLLRGEEEAGRFELVLVGRTSRGGATAQAVAGLAAGPLVVFVVTAVATAVVGHDSSVAIGAGTATFLALALVVSAVMFAALGALTSQLCPTRRRAAAYGGAAVGISFVIRMVADADPHLGWLRWASPLGWVEQLRPVTAPDGWALAPVALLSLAAAGLAVALASRRDLGASILPDRTAAAARTGLLGGPAGLVVRLGRSGVAAWALAVGGLALIVGFIAKAGGSAITDSPAARRAFARLGDTGTGTRLFLGLTFLLVAALLSLVAAGQISAARSSESDGLLEHLLVRSTRRSTWFLVVAALGVAVVLACGLVAGTAAWLGQASQHGGVPYGVMVNAGLSLAAPGIFVLGLGALALGVLPRGVDFITYGFVGWSFLLEFIGGIIGLNHWILDTSVFHQLATAPAVSPDWATNGVVMGLGALGIALGMLGFLRRDLRGA